ncbi:MAG: hypothetical protein KAS67_05030 [Thermoplasmata archaeon]|nr:hypothetical protein [Thermoplasmata archaeon]
MVNELEMQIMEEIIVEHAGPLGKFVIKKSITDIGGEPEQYNRETLDRFIDMILERAVYDSTKWEMIKRNIFAAWKIVDSTLGMHSQ